jgi:hypothetical protein
MTRIFNIILLLAESVIFISCSAAGFSEFITADQDKLMEGDEEFRFISFNIPNLHYIEDYFPFEETNPWRLPDEYEIRDALTSIKQMGGRVARTYVISVRRQDDQPGLIRHVEGPNQFNEEAFKALDKVLQVANEEGIRLIIPLVDNWWWMGGRGEYAAFRHKERDEFWSDSQLIEDFKNTISYVLNRENAFTGELYKNDKAVLGWETGNELQAPIEWQSMIAAYIKSIDKNHLVIENTHSALLTQAAVNDTNLDVVSTHFYEQSHSAIPKILTNREMTKSIKPYFVGEFGFIPSSQFDEILDAVIDSDISGALLWSLRFHNRDGGYYKHYEKFGFSAYNWPGYYFNQPYDEKAVLELMKDRAYKISKLENEYPDIPESPVLLPADNVHKISWQGSTGANLYVIERSMDNSSWKTIDVVNDTEISYRPLYSDTEAEKGRSYYYRLRAWNGEHVSDHSNVIGPIKVDKKMIVDEMFNDQFIYKTYGDVEFLSMENVRQAKEDRSRLTATQGSFIIYNTVSDIDNIVVDVFYKNENSELKFLISMDDINYQSLKLNKDVYEYSKNDYGFFTPVRFSAQIDGDGFKFLKILFNGHEQISRVEIVYDSK